MLRLSLGYLFKQSNNQTIKQSINQSIEARNLPSHHLHTYRDWWFHARRMTMSVCWGERLGAKRPGAKRPGGEQLKGERLGGKIRPVFSTHSKSLGRAHW